MAYPAQTVADFPDHVHESEMLWVDAESPTSQELADLKTRFGLDDYAVEDVVHKNQRPKLEEYGKSVYGVIHVPDVGVVGAGSSNSSSSSRRTG